MGQKIFDNEAAGGHSQRAGTREGHCSSLDSHISAVGRQGHDSFYSGRSEQFRAFDIDRDRSTQHNEQSSHEDSITTQNTVNRGPHFAHEILSVLENDDGRVEQSGASTTSTNHPMEQTRVEGNAHETSAVATHPSHQSSDEPLWDESHQAELQHRIGIFQYLSENANFVTSTASPLIYNESLHGIFLRYINHVFCRELSRLPFNHPSAMLYYYPLETSGSYVSSMNSLQMRTMIRRLIANLRAARAVGVRIRWSSRDEFILVDFECIIDQLGGPTRILWEQLFEEVRASVTDGILKAFR
ncbi:hypothetical protein ACMFMG_008142 [Clarireedia jacksonii]